MDLMAVNSSQAQKKARNLLRGDENSRDEEKFVYTMLFNLNIWKSLTAEQNSSKRL